MTGPAALRKVPPYDPTTDFTPISLIGDATLFLCLHPSVPATTLAEFISYARANPGKLNFGTGNPLAHLQTTALMKFANISMLHVPYKGNAPVVSAFANYGTATLARCLVTALIKPSRASEWLCPRGSSTWRSRNNPVS